MHQRVLWSASELTAALSSALYPGCCCGASPRGNDGGSPASPLLPAVAGICRGPRENGQQPCPSETKIRIGRRTGPGNEPQTPACCRHATRVPSYCESLNTKFELAMQNDIENVRTFCLSFIGSQSSYSSSNTEFCVAPLQGLSKTKCGTRMHSASREKACRRRKEQSCEPCLTKNAGEYSRYYRSKGKWSAQPDCSLRTLDAKLLEKISEEK